MINNLFGLSKKKEKTEQSIWYHPGLYKFYMPYINHMPVSNDKDQHTVYSCQVEVHVGMQNDMDEGKLATIIIKSDDEGLGVTNYIEDIATKVRLSFFDKIFHEDIINSNENILDTRLRWLEYVSPQYTSALPDGSLREVHMDWDIREKRYIKPDWTNYEGFYADYLKSLDREIKKGEVYLSEFNMGKYPMLGNYEKVLILSADNEQKTVTVAPITSYSYKSLGYHVPPICIGKNDLGIDEYTPVLIRKVATINIEDLKEKLGRLDNSKLEKVINDYKKILDDSILNIY